MQSDGNGDSETEDSDSETDDEEEPLDNINNFLNKIDIVKEVTNQLQVGSSELKGDLD